MSDFNTSTMAFEGSYYFVNKTGSSNKWWKITFQGGSKVLYTYARIGQECSRPITKDYGGLYKMQSEARKKIEEKLREGYEHVQEEKLQHETKIAQMMGTKNKLQELYYVTSRDAGSITFTSDAKQYNPAMGVVAMIIDSWSKEESWLWLNKDQSENLVAASKQGSKIVFSRMTSPDSGFVRGVREYIKGMAMKVKQFINTFGANASRVLFGEHNDEVSDEVVNKFQAQSPEMNKSLIASFAALGDRMLEI